MANKLEPIRIVLIGQSDSGKTSTMNTLLGSPCLTGLSSSSRTTECEVKSGKHGEQTLVVIDTPGWFNNKTSDEEVVKEICKSVIYAAPGPHVFLYVLTSDAITTEGEQMKKMEKIFGEESKNYFLALFTHKDEHSNIPPEFHEMIMETPIKNFGGGYFWFDNKGENSEQMDELLKKINHMVEKRKYYTSRMFEEAQKALERSNISCEGMTSDDEGLDLLKKAADTILTATIGEPLKELVTGTVGLVAQLAYEWVKQ